MLNIKREHIFIITIILVIIIAGSGVLIYQTIRQNKFITEGLQDKNTLSESGRQHKEQKSGDADREVKDIYIHITGAVKNCGVYKLKTGDRIVDAVKAAGGGSDSAALDKINLAARLFDGDQIYIPDENDLSKADKQLNISKNNKSKMVNKSYSTGKININSADKSQLEELPGIGPSKAQKILDYRRKIGQFKNFQQLLSVSGIGEKTLKKIEKELSLR